jgi:hypothetical protein
MRSGTLASLSTVAVVAASALALVCLSAAVPEPPGRIATSDAAAPVVDAAPSLFIASGGLVPDALPPSEAASDEASTHAVVAATQLGTH